MNQYNEISTLQYMGSKTRIISHICEPIIKNKSIKTVVDLFAGTGSVGYALKAHKNIISNDLEYYAYIINHAILNGCDFSVTDEISFWNAVEQQSASLQAKVCTAVTTENKFFIDTVDYKQYQLFCEKTPSVFMPQSDDPRLKEILDLVDQVTPGKAPTVETPCLFLTYYANAYFGIAQCCQIDAIRSNIGQIEDKRTRYVLLTMLMSVMSASASTTTHFAQYLKVKSKATCNNLIGKRKINIIESCKSLLAEYRQAGLCTADRKAPSVCYNLDFSDCLDSISLNNETLVYADPPYFKEHYSRYYHVLISFSPKYSISYVMGYLKGKSSLMIFDRHANLKYKYGNRHFWARGYFVDTVGKNKQRIQEYIKRQLEQDQIADQLSLKEFTDPFTGSKGTKA